MSIVLTWLLFLCCCLWSISPTYSDSEFVAERPALWSLQVPHPVTPTMRKNLTECLSVKKPLDVYRPPNTFVVVGVRKDWEACSNHLERATLLSPQEKLSPIITSWMVPDFDKDYNTQHVKPISLRIRLFPHLLSGKPWTIELCETWCRNMLFSRSMELWFCDRDGNDIHLHLEAVRPLMVRYYLIRFTKAWQTYEVDWAQPQQLLNREAQWLLQSNRPEKKNPRPLWNVGLRGERQVIGVADSGLDRQHPFFTEPTDKVLLYDALYGDEYDEKSGHGTHVVGSIAGYQTQLMYSVESHSQTNYNYSGMAPAANIAFFDVQKGPAKGFNIPPAISYMFDKAKDVGASVFSNSWGCNGGPDVCNRYTSLSQSVDRYAYNNPDFLILFAAGNDGNTEDHITGSVLSPGTAKNALTVGASQTSHDGWWSALSFIPWAEREQNKRVQKQDDDFDCCSLFSTSKWYCCRATVERQLRWYSDDYRKENVALFSGRGPTSDGRAKPDIVGPGQYIVSAKSEIRIGNDDVQTEDDTYTDAHLLLSMSGTSMATPVVAGGILLLRQYFVDGWYDWARQIPNQTPNSNHSVIPSSALLKALVIGGARTLQGSVELSPQLWPLRNEVPLDTTYPPSVFQGFGAVVLEKSLGMVDGFFPHHHALKQHTVYMWDVKSKNGLQSLETHHWCLHDWQAGGSLRVTLVWNDYPGSITTNRTLVNNLDLVVMIPNQNLTQSQKWAGNFRVRRDARNNVEVVELPPSDILIKRVQILVRGFDVPLGPQSYALVIHGGLFGNVSACTDGDLLWAALPYDYFPEANEDDHFPTYELWKDWQIALTICVALVGMFIITMILMRGCIACFQKKNN